MKNSNSRKMAWYIVCYIKEVSFPVRSKNFLKNAGLFSESNTVMFLLLNIFICKY